jgi:hypothetical protein
MDIDPLDKVSEICFFKQISNLDTNSILHIYSKFSEKKKMLLRYKNS